MAARKEKKKYGNPSPTAMLPTAKFKYPLFFNLRLFCQLESIQTLTWKCVHRLLLINVVSQIPVPSVITLYFTQISK
jgi:hypothetical protein